MKWRGTDADRANASAKVFEEGFEGFGTRENFGFIPAAEQDVKSGLLATTEGRSSGPNIGRGDTGPIRTGGGAYQPHRLRGAAETLSGMSPMQRKNLGLLSKGPR